MVFLTTRSEPLTGINFLVSGWLGPLVGEFSWYANLFYGWALLRLLFNNAARVHISTTLAVLLALTSLTYVNAGFDLSVGASKGEGVYHFYGIGIGYFLWLASMMLLWLHVLLSSPDGSEAGPAQSLTHKVKIFVAASAVVAGGVLMYRSCLLYTSPSPRDATLSRMPSSA